MGVALDIREMILYHNLNLLFQLFSGFQVFSHHDQLGIIIPGLHRLNDQYETGTAFPHIGGNTVHAILFQHHLCQFARRLIGGFQAGAFRQVHVH